MTRRHQDSFHRRAKAAGYRARSAYKLAELDTRFRLLHPGDAVVDLGASPGGWLQVAAERVGPRGRVVAIDLSTIAPLPVEHVVTLQGDVRDPDLARHVRDVLGRRADVVLSDLAPKLTGVRATDEARMADLVMATLAMLPAVLTPGGRLLVKLFMSPEYRTTLAEMRAQFATVRTTRPDATRRASSELYAVALGFRAS